MVTDGRFLSTTCEDTGGNEEGSDKSNKGELLGAWSCEFDIPKDPVVRPGDTWVLRDTCDSGILGTNGIWGTRGAAWTDGGMLLMNSPSVPLDFSGMVLRPMDGTANLLAGGKLAS